MAGSLNKVTLIGHVGKDPEIKTMANGARGAFFSLATSESWKSKQSGERKEKTEWHRISVWNDGLIGVIERFVKKGSKLYLEGSLETRKWNDQAGVEKYSTEIVIKQFRGEIVLLDSKGAATISAQSQHNTAKQDGYTPKPSSDIDDDIPF
jgi:single-strand DNA-binding protein